MFSDPDKRLTRVDNMIVMKTSIAPLFSFDLYSLLARKSNLLVLHRPGFSGRQRLASNLAAWLVRWWSVDSSEV